MLILALDNTDIKNIRNKILLGLIFLNLKSEYNRFFLAFYAMSRSYNLFFDFYNDESIKRKSIFKRGVMLLTISVLVWLADIFLCKYLYFSIHWLWHILSSYALFFIINYCILIKIHKHKIENKNYKTFLDMIYNF